MATNLIPTLPTSGYGHQSHTHLAHIWVWPPILYPPCPHLGMATNLIPTLPTSGYGHQSHTHLAHDVEIFNSCVAPSEKISLDSILSSPMWQKALSSKLDDLQFQVLFNMSSVADRPHLLSISAPHSSSWLSVVPSEGLGLHFEPNQ